MNLTAKPESVNWPETHYVFVERVGPFQQNAPAAWESAHTFTPALSEHNRIAGYMSLYKMGPPNVYRAGFALAAPPVDLPGGLQFETFKGGKYSKFVLIGPYSQLGEATGKVWKIVAEQKIPLRDDYAIENYVNDPRVTPEDQLITEVLIPTA